MNSGNFVAGQSGAPGKLSVDEDGIFWLGIPGIRDVKFEKLADKPLVRRLLGALPRSTITLDRSLAFILGFDRIGEIHYNLQHVQSAFDATTGAVRINGMLYIASLGTDVVGVLELPIGY